MDRAAPGHLTRCAPAASPSSRGLGSSPFKAKTRVRIPLGTPPTSSILTQEVPRRPIIIGGIAGSGSHALSTLSLILTSAAPTPQPSASSVPGATTGRSTTRASPPTSGTSDRSLRSGCRSGLRSPAFGAAIEGSTHARFRHRTRLRNLDLQLAVVARAPLLRRIERAHGQGVAEAVRGEDEIQLAGRRGRCLASRVIGRNVAAVPGKLAGPWISLSSVRSLRSDEEQSDRTHSREYGLVASGPKVSTIPCCRVLRDRGEY